jgi:hypothetical protein
VSSFGLAVTIIGVSVGTFSLLSLFVTAVTWWRKQSERGERLRNFKQQQKIVNEDETHDRSTDPKESQEKFTVGDYISDPQVRSWVDAKLSARYRPEQEKRQGTSAAEQTDLDEDRQREPGHPGHEVSIDPENAWRVIEGTLRDMREERHRLREDLTREKERVDRLETYLERAFRPWWRR